MSLYAVGVDLGTMQNAGAVPTIVRKTVTFVAGTTGATTTHALFTVTGAVRVVQLSALCTVSLTVGGSTTLTVGNATDTAMYLDGTDSPIDLTDVDAGTYLLATDIVASQSTAITTVFTVENITYTVGTSTITGGALQFICEYIPLSAGASVVAA